MANGQQIDSGQGSLVYETSPVSDTVAGSEGTTAAGDLAKNRLLPLKSRKTGTGQTSRLLTGLGSSFAQGTVIGGPGAVLTSSAIGVGQGALVRSRAKGLTGGAVSVGAGSVSAPGSTDFIVYTANEGTAIGPSTTSQYWQSAFTTNDGTLIDWGTSDHGHGSDNGVREYDPISKTQTYVKPRANYDVSISGKQIVGGNYGNPTQYDNLYYHYIPRIDSWVLPGGAVYNRATGQWTHAFRTEANITDNTAYSTGNSLFDGLPLGWKGDKVTGTDATSIIRPYGAAMNSGPDYIAQYTGDFNPHQAWSSQLDAGVRVGGGSGGGGPTDRPYMWVIAPGANFGITAQPYVVFRRDLPATVGGVAPFRLSGRDGACFVGTWVYWYGGAIIGSTTTPHLFRMNLAPHVVSDSTSFTTGAGAIERLNDAPFSTAFPLLRHDAYSNALILWGSGGIAMFDLRTLTWDTITPAAYSSFFDSGTTMPNGCLGDFIDTKSGTQLRKFYWRPGLPSGGEGGWTTNATAKKTSFHSLKIQRPADQISYLDITLANPEAPASNYGNLFLDIKHQGLVVSGTGASRALTLISGDFAGYPFGTLQSGKGYKPEGSLTESGRQDIWRAPIGTTQIASGSVRFSMVSNAYAAYPWNGSAGVNAGAAEGPRAMDAIGAVVDKRGQWWVGPADNNDYVDALPEIAGQTNTYAPVYKWTLPGTNATAYGVTGVALGNGWEKPTQDRLYKPGSGGTLGIDYDVSFSGAGDGFGWGRTNARGSVYDATNDKIYVLSAGVSGKTFSVQLYGFNCDPAAAASAGKFAWAKSALQTKNIKDFGGPADNQYTGINMSGWGDNAKGTINCAPEMIGRNIYFVALWGYTGVTNGLTANRPEVGAHCRAHLMSINVDTLAMEWLPFPETQNWWLRAWDGPNSVEGGTYSEALTPAQYRTLACVGDKLVLGPDSYTKIGVDPWIQVYDTTRKTWTSFQPPTNHDWPQTLAPMVGVPDLGEVWLVGSQPAIGASTFRINNGLHQPTATSGRRIVRFKVDSTSSYSTTFSATENPISESSKWTNGGTTGVNWRNVQTTGGIACGASFVTGYDDPIAVLNTSFTANQYAQGIVSRAGGYSPGVNHEIELLLRFQITSGNARGYEVLWGHAGNGAVVRWNGPLGNYTALLDNRPWGAAVDGDVLKAQISGSTITVYKNGVQIDSVTDSTYSDGQPGIGFWPQSGSTLTSYGWKDFTAGSL